MTANGGGLNNQIQTIQNTKELPRNSLTKDGQERSGMLRLSTYDWPIMARVEPKVECRLECLSLDA